MSLSYLSEFLEFNECGSEIFLKNKDETTIFSPGFPLNYGQGINCVWSIESDNYVKIEIVYIKLQKKILVNDLQKASMTYTPNFTKTPYNFKIKLYDVR